MVRIQFLVEILGSRMEQFAPNLLIDVEQSIKILVDDVEVVLWIHFCLFCTHCPVCQIKLVQPIIDLPVHCLFNLLNRVPKDIIRSGRIANSNVI